MVLRKLPRLKPSQLASLWMLTKLSCLMNYFLAGFACGFTLGFLLAAIIAILLGVLAVLSLTMDASDLPKNWLRSASKKLSL